MAKNMLITENLFVEMVDTLRLYADAEWGWNGLDESVVTDWPNESIAHPDHHFKDGGCAARKMVERAEMLLLRK